MARNQEFASRIHAKIGSLKSEYPELSLASYDRLTEDKSPAQIYRIVASHPKFEYTADKYEQAVSNLFDNKFSLVAGTLKDITHEHEGQVTKTMLVAFNREVRDYSNEAVEGMVVIAANMFEDSNDTIWNVTGEGDNRKLVQLSEDNSDEIMAARISRKSVTASAFSADDSLVDVKNGDYVLAYDVDRDEVVSGFILEFDDGVKVIDRNTLNNVTIANAGFIIEAVDGESLEKNLGIKSNEVTATFTKEQAKAYLDYARVLYAGTKYFADLEDWINRSLMNGSMSFSTSTAQ